MSYIAIWQSQDEMRLETISVKLDDEGNKIGHSREVATKMAIAVGAVDYEIILFSDMPSEDGDNLAKNWAFRDAWVHDKTDSPQKISVNVALARDISLVKVKANVLAAFIELNKEAQIAMSDGMTLDEARELTRERGDILKGATDKLKALDVNKDGIISVEEAAGLLLPLELIA